MTESLGRMHVGHVYWLLRRAARGGGGVLLRWVVAVALLWMPCSAVAYELDDSCLSLDLSNSDYVASLDAIDILYNPQTGISQKFEMRSALAEGKKEPWGPYQKDTSYCTREKQTDITFCYGSPLQCTTAQTGALVPIQDAHFQVIASGGLQCVQIDLLSMDPALGIGWVTLGCKPEYIPPTAAETLPACGIGASCVDNTVRATKVILPMSSTVVQCVADTLGTMFRGTSDCKEGEGFRMTVLANFQNSLRNTVFAALVLYTILFGMQQVLHLEIVPKRDIFMFFIRMFLVIYFSTGFPNQNGGYDSGVPWLFDVAIGTSQSFSAMMFGASGQNGLCNFNHDSYEFIDAVTRQPTSMNILRLWDGIDCRIFYYLGGTIEEALYGALGAATPALLIAMLVPSVASWIFPALLGGQIILIIFLLIFLVMFVSVLVHVVHIYLVAMFGVAIAVYVAPLFVPMVLFQFTKEYFDNWYRLVLAYTLQPVVLVMFLTLMVMVFDKVMYGGCEFVRHDISLPQSIFGSTITAAHDDLENTTPTKRQAALFTLKSLSIPAGANPWNWLRADTTHLTDQERQCFKSFGYQMHLVKEYQSTGDAVFSTIHALFFPITIWFNYEIVPDLLQGMLTALFFVFLFYHFSTMVSGLAADLMGGGAISGVISPKAGAKAAMTMTRTLMDGLADKMKQGKPRQPGFRPRGGGAAGGGGGGSSISSAGSSSTVVPTAPRGGAR